ncbi:hypothetical protein IWW38_003623, partial [Coemansia aciculifera]
MPIAASAGIGSLSAVDRVLASAQYISEHSTDVSVPLQGVERAAARILKRMQSVGYSTASWKQHALTPSLATASAIEWIFTVDALNFSFWSTQSAAAGSAQYAVTYDGVAYRGYWSLCAAVNRALAEGIAITDAAYWCRASDSELAHVFRSDPGREPMPMLQERLAVLREAGQVLVRGYGGRFANLLAGARGSARRLVDTVVAEFACFRDEHQFQGQPVAMYKRAQIL